MTAAVRPGRARRARPAVALDDGSATGASTFVAGSERAPCPQAAKPAAASAIASAATRDGRRVGMARARRCTSAGSQRTGHRATRAFAMVHGMAFRAGLALFVGAATLVALAPGCTEAPRGAALGQIAQANQGTDTTAHPFAVAICLGAASAGACPRICSGTLVAPNLILTARHCVDNDTGVAGHIRCGVDSFTTRSSPPAQTFVTTKATLAQGGWRAVSEIRTPTESDGCASDIALLVLSANVPSAEATPADVLAFGPMTDHSRYATEVSMIGYGLAGADKPGTFGTRRILRSVPIQCIVGDPLFADPFCKGGGVGPLPDGGSEDSLDDKANFQVAWGVCSGDSGSAALEETQFRAGKPLAMGVLSRSGNDSGVCLEGIYTRTDRWKDFLVQGATAAAQLGGYALPAWASGPTVPAPPVDAGRADARATLPDGAVEPAPGEKGASCTRSAECDSTACVAVEGRDAVCVDVCGDGRTCAQGETCVTVEGGDVCVPLTTRSRIIQQPAAEPEGCTVGPRPGATTLPVLLAWAAALRRRRRRSA